MGQRPPPGTNKAGLSCKAEHTHSCTHTYTLAYPDTITQIYLFTLRYMHTHFYRPYTQILHTLIVLHTLPPRSKQTMTTP